MRHSEASDNVYCKRIRLSNYDTGNMLVKVSRPRLVQCKHKCLAHFWQVTHKIPQPLN